LKKRDKHNKEDKAFLPVELRIAIQPSYGNNQDAPLLMNESRKCGTCTQWNFIHP
jgi:hypothetical protein